MNDEWILLIEVSKIKDPELKEAFRRLGVMVHGIEFYDTWDIAIPVSLKRPDLIGKQWAFPPWMHLLGKRYYESIRKEKLRAKSLPIQH